MQTTIALDGKQVGPIYLCLQGPKGKTGATVQKNLFEPSNVIITCSPSGKLTSSLGSYGVTIVFYFLLDISLLLSDSWSAQNNTNFYDKVDCNKKNITRIQIPQKTTNNLQALDVYYNCQMKNVIKRIQVG